MSRLYRTIARLKTGQKIDAERMLGILSRLADNAPRYADGDERLADIPVGEIADALDWAVCRIEAKTEDTTNPKRGSCSTCIHEYEPGSDYCRVHQRCKVCGVCSGYEYERSDDDA